MRLIDADELKKDIDGYDYSEEGYSDRMDFKFIYEVIDNQPTVEAKPVVHGEWMGRSYYMICSNCKEEYMEDLPYIFNEPKIPNFCPNCGCSMKKE